MDGHNTDKRADVAFILSRAHCHRNENGANLCAGRMGGGVCVDVCNLFFGFFFSIDGTRTANIAVANCGKLIGN